MRVIFYISILGFLWEFMEICFARNLLKLLLKKMLQDIWIGLPFFTLTEQYQHWIELMLIYFKRQGFSWSSFVENFKKNVEMSKIFFLWRL